MGTARRFHATGDGDLEPDKHVVEVTYASVSSLSFKLGSYGTGSGSFDIEFRGFSFASDSGGSGGSGSATAETLATTGSSSSMWAMAIGGLGFVIAGAVLAMQGVRRRSLTEG
jgi:LPXTG-motif cell wall-anchored protein